MDEHVSNFIRLVERAYLSDRTTTRAMDMGKVMQLFTQDVTSAVEFSEPFGYIDANADKYGVIAALESMQLGFAIQALLPSLLAVVTSRFFKPFMPKPTDPSGVGHLLGMIQSRVAERYGPDKKRRADALQAFVDSGLSREEVEAEAMVHLLGGSDTTATALRNTIFFIATNPVAYRRVQAEIDAAVAAGNVTRPVLTDAQAKALPYLQATIKEALRMWPPIMGIMPKVSESKDDIICGNKIPRGTWVAWSPMAIMKNKEVFGGDADVFEPRRWLDSDATRLREMEATQGLVFMSGTRWECLGRKLAYVEMGKMLFEVSPFLSFLSVCRVGWIGKGKSDTDQMMITALLSVRFFHRQPH